MYNISKKAAMNILTWFVSVIIGLSVSLLECCSDAFCSGGGISGIQIAAKVWVVQDAPAVFMFSTVIALAVIAYHDIFRDKHFH